MAMLEFRKKNFLQTFVHNLVITTDVDLLSRAKDYYVLILNDDDLNVYVVALNYWKNWISCVYCFFECQFIVLLNFQIHF